MWICDSGACSHYCQAVEELTEIKDIDKAIMIGNGESMHTTKVGNLKCEVTQVDESKFPVMLKEVKYKPDLCVNLLSLNKALKILRTNST